jgi:hypothetical protein
MKTDLLFTKFFKTFFLIVLTTSLFIVSEELSAQDLSVQSHDITVDFREPKKNFKSSAPMITWQSPEQETTFSKEGKISLKVSVECKSALKNVTVTLREKGEAEVRSTMVIPVGDADKFLLGIDRSVTLPEGIMEVAILAENEHGIKSESKRNVYAGTTAWTDAGKLQRTDYALIFGTDKYDNWHPLVNPVHDARTVASELEKVYGFQTTVMENATQEQIFATLRQFAEKKYGPMDQLFIFFAGHGFYDETFKEGFIVTKESLPTDPGRTSYVRHSSLRSTINNNPCEHIFLVMDVCFGGTFDEDVSRGAMEDVYKEPSQAALITRKLQYKTRKYLTSGGKEYVSDGTPGKHSPFAKQFIEALKTHGGNDGILTLSELMSHIERLKTAPQFGKFGNDKQGSEFVFVIKQ